MGHTALICYHRTNLQYKPGTNPKNLNTYVDSTSGFTPHIENQGNSSTTSELTVGDAQWYMDSGATYHFTPNYNLLDDAMPYTGSEQVTVGDGKQLSISHVGHAKLNTITHSTPLVLKDILHTPFLSHNLLSVAKLCGDNRAYIEFHANSFLVKH